MKFFFFSLTGFLLIVSFNNCGQAGRAKSGQGYQDSNNDGESSEQNAPVQEPTITLDTASGQPQVSLSATGLRFGTTLENWNSALVPYELNSPLWTDYALKERFILLPEGEKMIFTPYQWALPNGTTLIKQFSMEISPGNIRPLETRLLRKISQSSWDAYTYKWNATGTDATLITDSPGENQINLEIQDGAKGGPRSQVYLIPTRQSCTRCHAETIGFKRGIKTGQLNLDIGGVNQIDAFAQRDLFSNPEAIPADKNELDRFYALDSPGASDYQKLESYLAVHCSSCHHNGSSDNCDVLGNSFRIGSFRESDLTAPGPENAVIPGAPDSSPLYLAVNRSAGGQMPRVGTNIEHTEFVEFLRGYIQGLDPGAPSEPPPPPPPQPDNFANIPVGKLFAENNQFSTGVFKKVSDTESCRVVVPNDFVTVDAAIVQILKERRGPDCPQ